MPAGSLPFGLNASSDLNYILKGIPLCPFSSFFILLYICSHKHHTKATFGNFNIRASDLPTPITVHVSSCCNASLNPFKTAFRKQSCSANRVQYCKIQPYSLILHCNSEQLAMLKVWKTFLYLLEVLMQASTLSCLVTITNRLNVRKRSSCCTLLFYNWGLENYVTG
jgi:hypothetical protein